jgi:hypothetical protein
METETSSHAPQSTQSGQPSQASAWAKHPALHWAIPANHATKNPPAAEENAMTGPVTDKPDTPHATETNGTNETTGTTRKDAEASANPRHCLSPDGTRKFWRIGDANCGLVFLQKAGDKPATINITGYGACFWHPDSRHILQNQVQKGGDIHVVQYDTDLPSLTGHDMTPWPGATAQIVQSTTSGDWLTPIQVITNKRTTALFDFYTTQGDDVHNDGSVVQWLTNEDGRLGGRVRSVNGEYLFEVVEAKTNAMYGNSNIHFSEVYRWTEGKDGKGGKDGKDSGREQATIKWTWHGFSALHKTGGNHVHVNAHPVRRSTLPGAAPASKDMATEER